jgi:hypothetical protein
MRPPWDDAHIPPAGDDPALRASGQSLLDVEAVQLTEAAAAGAEGAYRGVKGRCGRPVRGWQNGSP